MHPSFYMQYTVDKQQKLEAGSWKLEGRSLFRRFREANNNFAILVAERIRENIGDIILPAQLLVQSTRFSRTDEDERDIPAREYGLRDLRKYNTRRRTASRQIFDGYSHLFLTLAALAHLLRSRVYLTELHELVVGLATDFGNEGAFVADILRPSALEVAAVAHLAHEAKPLRPAGEAADKRGRTLVLPAPYLDSCISCHSEETLAHEAARCLFFLDDGLETLDEAVEGQDGFFLRAAIAQDGGTLERLLASHDKEVGAIAPLGEIHLFGQGFDADVLC